MYRDNIQPRCFYAYGGRLAEWSAPTWSHSQVLLVEDQTEGKTNPQNMQEVKIAAVPTWQSHQRW